jgi:hypothetical protein
MRLRIPIPPSTTRLVLARSGGYCANPSCRRDLFPPIGTEGKVATVGKLAHIIGQSPRGPRGRNPMPLAARNDASNIILLCPYCHDLVDDMNATDQFTPEVLRAWKRDHEDRVRHGAAVPTFDDRDALNEEIRALLRKNRAVWEQYSPESKAGQDPLSELAQKWREEVVATLIPNNRRILELIEANRTLFTDEELDRVEAFRLHAAALDLNFTSRPRRAGAPRFPADFDSIFTD